VLAARCRKLGVALSDAGSFFQKQLDTQPVEVGRQ